MLAFMSALASPLSKLHTLFIRLLAIDSWNMQAEANMVQAKRAVNMEVPQTAWQWLSADEEK